MLEHFGLFDECNGGCHPDMDYLECGQIYTSVWSYVTLVQIDYVRTVDLGPDLSGCDGPPLCFVFDPHLVIDLTPGAFQTGLGVPLSAGIQKVWVWQP